MYYSETRTFVKAFFALCLLRLNWFQKFSMPMMRFFLVREQLGVLDAEVREAGHVEHLRGADPMHLHRRQIFTASLLPAEERWHCLRQIDLLPFDANESFCIELFTKGREDYAYATTEKGCQEGR